MFTFFRRKPKRRGVTNDSIPDLIFKSSENAFDYACKYLSHTVKKGTGHVAIVLDSRERFSTREAVKRRDDGIQIATLKVADHDGGFLVIAQTAIPDAPPLYPGDIVSWVAGKYMPELATTFASTNSGWIGLIYGVLLPEIEVKTGRFRTKIDYRALG